MTIDYRSPSTYSSCWNLVGRRISWSCFATAVFVNNSGPLSGAGKSWNPKHGSCEDLRGQAEIIGIQLLFTEVWHGEYSFPGRLAVSIFCSSIVDILWSCNSGNSSPSRTLCIELILIHFLYLCFLTIFLFLMILWAVFWCPKYYWKSTSLWAWVRSSYLCSKPAWRRIDWTLFVGPKVN